MRTKKIVSGQQKFADSKKLKNETKQRPPLPLFYACETFFFFFYLSSKDKFKWAS